MSKRGMHEILNMRDVDLIAFEKCCVIREQRAGYFEDCMMI